MDADLLADSHAGWKGVVIKMSMSGMCFSSSAGRHRIQSGLSTRQTHPGKPNKTKSCWWQQTGAEVDACMEGAGKGWPA